MLIARPRVGARAFSSRLRTVALGISVLAVLGMGARPAAVVAAPPASTALGSGFNSLIVDSARSHVIVSDPVGNVVRILDYTGTSLSTIGNIYGAAGMVIQGVYLYVAESTAGAIVRISLNTAAPHVKRIASGINQPGWLVATGTHLLWTAAADALVSVNTWTGVVKSFPTYYGADLATSAKYRDRIFVAEDGLSPGAVHELQISPSGTPTEIATNGSTDQSNIEQIAVSPDGKRVLPASGYPYRIEELSSKTLLPDGLYYPGNPYPSAIAVSDTLLAEGLDNGYSTPDIIVYPQGVPQAVFSASTNNGDGTANIAPHGLALTADGHHVFAVTSSYSSGYAFWSFAF